MAAQYDQLGNYLGDWETEEERRKREEEYANTAVRTQEIKTYGDGTVERTTTEEMAPAIQPVAVKPVQQMPTAPVVQQPVSPETFQRMIQAESGGRDFDAQGRPVTSPKGAMFAAQVMPATAASPGFGVRPAQAQTAEEYNRVGQDYYQAMLRQFGGDEQKAAAAYNAGPGRVQQAQQQAAQQGGSWTDYLPKETMGYLGKVFDKMIPSAQAGTLPAGQAQQPATITEPAQQQMTPAQRQMAIVTGQAQAQPAQAQPTTSTAAIQAYQTAQDDPMQLLALRNDKNAPTWIRERAGERAYELMSTEIKQKQSADQAKTLVAAAAAGDRKASNTIARELQNQEGSWLKMILLGFISPQLAGEEAVKLGFGNKWTQGYDDKGNGALIQVNAKGMPLKGYDAQGKELSVESLPAFMTGGKRNLDIVGGTYVNDKTGEVGRVITDKNTGQSFIQTDTGRKPMTGFRPQSSTGTLADMRTRAVQDLNIKLQGKGVEEQMQILRPYNQMLVQNGFPPVQPAEVGINVPQIGGGQAAPAAAPTGPVAPAAPQAGGAAGGAAGAAPAAPVSAVPPTMPQAGGIGGRPTATDIQVSKTGREEIIKKAGDVVATSDKLVGEITKAEQAAQDALTKKNNFGTIIHGTLPGEQTVGKFFKTEDYVNTQNILDVVNKTAATNAKMLGTNPTDRDLLFVTSTKPDETWSAEAVAEWLRRSAEGTRRTLDYARKQLESGGRFVPETPQENKEVPTKKLSREDQQAIEWVRKNPNDPRAAEIKKRLGL